MKSCLNNANLYLTGDSRVRQMYYVLKAILDGESELTDPKDREKRQFSINDGETKIYFFWQQMIKSTELLLKSRRKYTLDDKHPNYFILGSNWLWHSVKHKVNTKTHKPVLSSVEDHIKLALKYAGKAQTELKPAIDEILKKYPNTKFITDKY